MVLMVFNTLGRKKEEFVPIREKEVRIYVCGPTVYDYIHIGNARAFIFSDVVRRYLEYKGYKVRLVRNVTDIDDKIIKRAEEMGLSVQELAEKYTDAYFEDAKKLGIIKPDVNPRATQHIPEIIEAIRRLIERGYAYQADGDVYFDVTKFGDYGKLSGNRAAALRMGARIEANPKKRNQADFALWKAKAGTEISWESPWGAGRPGWHIECSTMAMKYLGETIDIHMGGKDLIFPHHENEIAQAEASTGRIFARYWLHNEWVTVNGAKMSKSLGNFITVRDALKICKPMELRLFLISTHYRAPLDFNQEKLEEARAELGKIVDSFIRFKTLEESVLPLDGEDELLDSIQKAKREFEEAMDDDFNTHLAIMAILEVVRAINSYCDRNKVVSQKIKEEVLKTFIRLLDVLGIGIPEEEAATPTPKYLNDLVALILDVREEMRRRKEWKTADMIRERLEKIGVKIEDTPEGPKVSLD
ncbi:MAG: cysteine--tRNA ligase [Candidatus Bathyarchaeota archaeon]|nr:cysteine--tRNA ligase [Candidatus Bathyarchaeota archaeon]